MQPRLAAILGYRLPNPGKKGKLYKYLLLCRTRSTVGWHLSHEGQTQSLETLWLLNEQWPTESSSPAFVNVYPIYTSLQRNRDMLLGWTNMIIFRCYLTYPKISLCKIWSVISSRQWIYFDLISENQMTKSCVTARLDIYQHSRFIPIVCWSRV